jgi:hypothetical protein
MGKRGKGEEEVKERDAARLKVRIRARYQQMLLAYRRRKRCLTTELSGRDKGETTGRRLDGKEVKDWSDKQPKDGS